MEETVGIYLGEPEVQSVIGPLTYVLAGTFFPGLLERSPLLAAILAQILWLALTRAIIKVSLCIFVHERSQNNWMALAERLARQGRWNCP